MLPDPISLQFSLPYYLAALAGGYLIGSIPFGVLLARVFGLGNLRKVGSGNIGATNVLRTGNKAAAALTLLFDMLKGVVAVGFALSFGPTTGALAALGAFLGHCYPVWLRFKGGKGVATFLGTLLPIDPATFALVCVVWLIVAFVLRYSSLAALIASVMSLPVLILQGYVGVIWVIVPMVALLWWRHRENLQRLVAGTESKISFGRKR